jgi:transposase
MERMMKVQEVLLRAMAKKITWWQAAEIIGVSARTMRRWRERSERDGYDGLADRRKGMVSPKRVPLDLCEKLLGLYRERYKVDETERNRLSVTTCSVRIARGSLPIGRL